MPRKALLGAALVAATLGCVQTSAHAQVFGAPAAIDSAQATDVTTTAAKLQASVRFNEKAGTWWFSYCRLTDCANGETETPHQEDNPETDAEAVAPRTIAWPVNALAPSTDYRVTVHAINDSARTPTTRTFTFHTAAPNIPAAPVAAAATTDAPTAIAPTTTTLAGTAVPGTTGGTGVGSSAFFEWGAAGGPLNQTTPAQSLPADANAYAISAGISGLTPGRQYSYRLVVVRAGVRTAGAVRMWQTVAAPNCLNQTAYQTVSAGRIRATGCFRADGNRWVADGDVRLNGVLLQPVGTAHSGNAYRFGSTTGLQSFLDAGNRLYIDRPGNALGTTGTWKMSVEHLVGMHQGVLNVRNVQWTGTAPLMAVGADRSVELFDFPLAGQLSLTPYDDGTSRLGVLVSLPLPRMDSVTGDAAVKVNPGGDLAFDRLRVEVGALPVRGFELGNVKFVYDRTEEQWEGAAEVTLPTASRVRVAAAVVVRHGRFGSFEGSVDGLNQHLAYGVFLQRIGVRVGVDPVHLGGSIGLSAGPKVGGVGILGVQGDFDVSAAGGMADVRLPTGRTRVVYPGSIKITGTGTVFDVPLRTASATWYFSQTPWIEASTQLGIDVKSGNLTVFKAMGTVAGSLYGRDFELAGGMNVTVFDINVANASAVLSTRGVGACGSVAGLGGIGAYKQWGGNYAQIWWCDMEDLRDLVAGTASLHAVGGAKALALPAGEGHALVRFMGQGGAPQVRLHGPGGRTIDTPAAGQGSVVKAGAFATIRDERSRYTDVLIATPGNGWTYEVLPGSVPVAHVRTAGELPRLEVAANVVRTGKTAELHWQLGNLAGRKVTFMEAGPGAPPRVLKRNATADGSVGFTPYVTPQRDRRIVAIVEQDGKPRSRLLVARYTAPAAPRMTRVIGLKALRHGAEVSASWKKVSGAAKYRVLVVERSGRRSMVSVKAPRLARRGADARSVTVRAVGFDGKVGRPRTAKVKAAR
jgi:hypothetical protein